MNDELKHFGVLGMRWGHRKNLTTEQKVSNLLKSKMSQIKNHKVTKGEKIVIGLSIGITGIVVSRNTYFKKFLGKPAGKVLEYFFDKKMGIKPKKYDPIEDLGLNPFYKGQWK